MWREGFSEFGEHFSESFVSLMGFLGFVSPVIITSVSVIGFIVCVREYIEYRFTYKSYRDSIENRAKEYVERSNKA